MRAALLQLCSGDDPAANLTDTRARLARAVEGGATLVSTPEITNCVSSDRAHQSRILRVEADDPTLAGLREEAARHGVWLHIGSLALKSADGGRFVNRGFLVAPDGAIAARYDKIHMFDVALGAGHDFRESDAYQPGDAACLARAGDARLGLTICYDLRFPALFRDLAQAGAEILMVPAAFSTVTGPAHWQVLLQARAIETGCYVLAAAQTGTHRTSCGAARHSHGHAMAVSPWGAVLAEAGAAPGGTLVDLDLSAVAEARRRIPSLSHDRAYQAP